MGVGKSCKNLTKWRGGGNFFDLRALFLRKQLHRHNKLQTFSSIKAFPNDFSVWLRSDHFTTGISLFLLSSWIVLASSSPMYVLATTFASSNCGLFVHMRTISSGSMLLELPVWVFEHLWSSGLWPLSHLRHLTEQKSYAMIFFVRWPASVACPRNKKKQFITS